MLADDLFCPEDVDRALRWRNGTAKRLAGRGQLPHYTLPNGEVRFRWADICAAVIPPLPDQRKLFVLHHGDAPQAGDKVVTPIQNRAPAMLVLVTPSDDATEYDLARLREAIDTGEESDILAVAAEVNATLTICRPRAAQGGAG